MGVLVSILKLVGQHLIAALITENILKEVMLLTLKKWHGKTKTLLDDYVYKILRKSWGIKPVDEEQETQEPVSEHEMSENNKDLK